MSPNFLLPPNSRGQNPPLLLTTEQKNDLLLKNHDLTHIGTIAMTEAHTGSSKSYNHFRDCGHTQVGGFECVVVDTT